MFPSSAAATDDGDSKSRAAAAAAPAANAASATAAGSAGGARLISANDDDWTQWTMNGVYQRRGFVLKTEDSLFGRRWKEYLLVLSRIRRELRGFKTVAAFRQHVRFYSHNEEFVIPLHRSTAYLALYLDQPFAFELVTPTAIYYFSTKSEEDLREWVLALADSGVTIRSPDKILLMPASNTLLLPMTASLALLQHPTPQQRKALAAAGGSRPVSRQNSGIGLSLTASALVSPRLPTALPVATAATPSRLRSSWGKHGYLQKRGFFNTSFKTRFFRTDENACGEPVLVYFDSMYTQAPKGHVRLTDAQLDNFVGNGDDGLQFTMLAGKRLYILRAPSRAEKSQWMAVLATLIAGNEEPPGVGDSLFAVDFDPYAVLSVDKDATSSQIAQAFKEQAKVMHPDKRGEGGQEEFMRLNEAYDILKDDNKRRWWDQRQKALEIAAAQAAQSSSSSSHDGRTTPQRSTLSNGLGLTITLDPSTPATPASSSTPASPRDQSLAPVFRKRVVKRGAKLSHTQEEIQAISNAAQTPHAEEKDAPVGGKRISPAPSSASAASAASLFSAASPLTPSSPTPTPVKSPHPQPQPSQPQPQPQVHTNGTAATPASSSTIPTTPTSASTPAKSIVPVNGSGSAPVEVLTVVRPRIVRRVKKGDTTPTS